MRASGFSGFIAASFLFSSCALLSPQKATRDLVYFRDADSVKAEIAIGQSEIKLQSDDILYIGVFSARNDSATRVFNIPNYFAGAGVNVSSFNNMPGYLIDHDGMIILPLIGKVKAAGLSKKELTEKLKSLLSSELIDPEITIRVVNFRISVLGEVVMPKTFEVPNDHITVFQAIGMAGDLTPYARRDNVLVIRDADGKKQMGRLNLNSTEVFTSPYYNLHQGDIVYVEPNTKKLPNTDQAALKTLSIITSTVSALALLFTIFK